MDSERLSVFIESFDRQENTFSSVVRQQALHDRIPVIRTPMISLIKTLLMIKKPAAILEIGTAVGYSALLMAENTPPLVRITTIEKYEKRIPVARENFKNSGMGDRITLMAMDAAQALEELLEKGESFDFIFMDAAKGQYPQFLKPVMRLLNPGGVLLSDNVLKEGDILESRYAVERRDRTIHARMREYLYEITHCDELQTTILETGDGCAISVKL